MTSSMADQQRQLCRRFSLAEIRLATGDFSDAHVIGKGGFGKVYKGLIDNGSVTVTVAVKRLSSNSNQGETEFEAEMETLTKFRHRNLVSLIGYCSEEEEMILVYEYMANGTLADHLYKLTRNDGSSNGSSLSWSQRLKICIGAGRGLDYLHSGCSIIHRDFKSTNILLDDNFTTKVSDFGLAKTNILESHVIASVKGSFGYFDPSYFTTGRLTKASDTYAFGVLLLEVLSGRPAIEPRLAEDELCMTMWAQERIRNGKADQIVALDLRGEVSEGCLKTFVGVVKRCLLYEPKKRLTVTRAVAQLELAIEQQERKGMTPPRLQLWSFWNRVIPSGSRQKDHILSQAIPAIEEEDEALQNKLQSVNMLPIYVPAFPVAEIKVIIDYCRYKRLIIDEFGETSVFHGVLKSGQYAVIIKHNTLPDDIFIAQVSLLSSLKHENVVELVGYCLDIDLQVLVYEFARRGSLHDILHGRQGITGLDLGSGPALSWVQRVKIAVGIATGLCYLHEKNLIRYNIKSSNVLVFDGEIAKLTNLHPSPPQCSCQKAFDEERHPRGFPPCYFKHSQYGTDGCPGQTQKGDVYGFGVVLLELLTGTTEFGHTEIGQRNLVAWAQPRLGPDKVHKIVDARLKAAGYPPKAVEKMAAVAHSCVQYQTEFRPDMSFVLEALKLMLPKPQHSPS